MAVVKYCCIKLSLMYICAPFKSNWEISSAGSEHLVYTEGVGGSNPSSPTKAESISF